MTDLEDFLEVHEETMRSNAEKCVKTNNIDYFIACYVEACTDGGKVSINKYSDLFTRQYFIEKEDELNDIDACVESLVFVARELMSYEYNKLSGSI